MKYKTLSIIIPVYNEKKYIKKILKIVSEQKLPLKKEIVIVDDCSTDGTRDILKKLKGYKIIFHKKNGGKGRAVRTGIRHSTGDIILIQDADLEYDPREYSKLLRPILNNKAKIVYGSRFRSQRGNLKKNQHLTYVLHSFGNRFLTFLTNLLFFSSLTDMETCYKVFTRDVIQKIPKLRARRFDLEPELTAKFLKSGFRIKEVPISYYSRDFDEGKKITWRDGVKAAYYLFRYRFFN